jgi:methyl-accepting chemotaxis protein
MSRNLAEAAHSGRNISENIGAVANTAQTTTQAASQTRQSAESLQKMATQLKALMSKFRYEDAGRRAMAAD